MGTPALLANQPAAVENNYVFTYVDEYIGGSNGAISNALLNV